MWEAQVAGLTFDLPVPPRQPGSPGKGMLPALILSPTGERGMCLLG